MIVLISAILIIASVIAANDAFGATKATVTASIGLNVRSGPGTTYSVVSAIPYGGTFTIMSTAQDKNGEDWYKISVNGIQGYVKANPDWIKIQEDVDYIYDEDFEKYLTSQGFPESYKDYLRELHTLHPNWVFKAQKTGLNWSDVIAKESVVGRNLIHQSYPDSWKSQEYGAYDPNTGKYVIFDSGGYVSASKSIIEYYMDPRNFLDESGVFQFMSHSYDSSTQTKSGLQKLVAGTFLDSSFPEKGYSTYSDIIMEAGKQSKANPYVLASMIILEQGSDGKGGSISGNVAGYKGYYNYFNINAYYSDGIDAVTNGLIYAKSQGWDTRTESILDGAAFYAKQYINNNQNTQYLKKFNVMNGLSNVATHQYMTNVRGAADEAATLKKGYASVIDTALTFNIPVYNNMPDTACPQPGSGNNDYYLKSLSVAGYSLTPAFNMYTSNYEVTVSSDTSYVDISAVARDSGAKVSGAGKVTLTGNATKVTITVTSSSGETKKYYITVARETNSGIKPVSSEYKVGTYITGVDFSTSVSSFKSKVKAPGGYTMKVTDSSGKEVTSGNIGTGMKVVVYNGSTAVSSTQIVVKGDTSGDGKISSVDILMAQRYVINTYSLSGAYHSGADINGDGKISSVDILMMQRHVIGTYTIKN